MKKRQEQLRDDPAVKFPTVGTVYAVKNPDSNTMPYVLYKYPHQSDDVSPASQLKNGTWLVLGYEKRSHRYGDSRDRFIVLTNGSCVGIFELHLFMDMINGADYRNITATQLA